MVNDRWKIMNSVSELEDGHQHKSQVGIACCKYSFIALLCSKTNKKAGEKPAGTRKYLIKWHSYYSGS